MQAQMSLIVIEPDTASLLIEALRHGSRSSPVSWITLATYAEMYTGNDTTTRTKVMDAMDDLLSLGVPVASKSNRKNGLGYFIIGTPNELIEAVRASDEYTAERLESINVISWYSKVKRQLQMLI
ncbi:MAG: hypothetical protein ACLS66_10275 [Weissella confusa]